MVAMDGKMLRSHFPRSWMSLLGFLILMIPALWTASGQSPDAKNQKASGDQVGLPASPTPSQDAQDLFLRLKAELVVLPISVTDSWGRFVPGLKREQFEIYEQEVPQTIRFFSTEDTPISVGIVLDTSGSMKSKIPRALEAVRKFIEWSNPQDEFFAITFNRHVTPLSDFTDGEMLNNYFLFLQAKGRTAVFDAVYQGVQKLRQARYGKRVLLVVSDGQDNSSRYGLRSLSRLLKESDIQIYTIGTPDPTQYNDYFERQGMAILERISRPTGGRHFTVFGTSGLEPVCTYVARELRQQYIIGYMSSNPAPDGQWRKIKVRAQPETSFRITQNSLGKLKSNGVSAEILERLAQLKNVNIKASGEDEYFSLVRRRVGEDLPDDVKSSLLAHVKRDDGEKLRVFAKRGYYAPRGQP